MSERNSASLSLPLFLIWIALVVLAIQVRSAAHEIATAKCPTAKSTEARP